MATQATVQLVGPGGPELIQLTGPTTVNADTVDVADVDLDARDDIQTEMMRLDLSGMSSVGPVQLHVRSVTDHPYRLTLGKIEETANLTPGHLDLRPLVRRDTTTATSFFDVYFEVDIPGAGIVLHNHWAKHVTSVITFLDPLPSTTFASSDSLTTLFYPNEQVSPFSIGNVTHTITQQYSGVPPERLPQTLAIQSIRPNPGVGSVTIELALPQRAPVRLVAYDVSGRVVQRLLEGTFAAGVRHVVWDGRDASGKKATAGMYFLRLESAGHAAVRRVVMLK
jgi:hypothetical protein